MKEILTVNVKTEAVTVIKGTLQSVSFVRFSGSSESDYFKGAILSGAVDTQRFCGDKNTLSARYVLEGIDYTGEKCHIFIENSANETARYTTPQ